MEMPMPAPALYKADDLNGQTHYRLQQTARF
jgi:hypothetical protein